MINNGFTYETENEKKNQQKTSRTTNEKIDRVKEKPGVHRGCRLVFSQLRMETLTLQIRDLGSRQFLFPSPNSAHNFEDIFSTPIVRKRNLIQGFTNCPIMRKRFLLPRHSSARTQSIPCLFPCRFSISVLVFTHKQTKSRVFGEAGLAVVI